MNREEYIQNSAELNMFWARIMKEHCIFIAAGLPCKDMHTAQGFDRFKVQFEMLLYEAAEIGGNLPQGAAGADFLLTAYTADAEGKTQALTGISINKRITQAQMETLENPRPAAIGKLPAVYETARLLNAKAERLARGLIELQNKVLDGVLEGKMFTHTYPAEYMHMNDEAREYINGLEALGGGKQPYTMPCAVQRFWDENMMQHAAGLRGLLDPTEAAMFARAQGFMDGYAALLKSVQQVCAENGDLHGVTASAAELTNDFKHYKTETVKAILNSRLKSVILPLYADHQLREANYYLSRTFFFK